ncbi:Uncharacterized protein OBRU01_00167, partial [Operophtera brumata]
MDLAETMKNVLAKSTGNSGGAAASSSATTPHPAEGYVTEKLYMLLQLYLQNKGWSPSIELLQCFSDLKDSSMLPSASYLQVGLDTQGRLILRDNGKIILPYEHFANAVMLKHMNGPHGLHLGVEATVRAVVESYTIGRDQFGMEKEFILEVIQNCPNPACRYYKSQLEMTQKSMQHLSQQPTYIPDKYSHSARSSTASAQAALDSKPKHHYSDEHKITDFLSGAPHAERGGGGGAGGGGGQERVVRAFAELARNLQRMRPCFCWTQFSSCSLYVATCRRRTSRSLPGRTTTN